MDQAKSMEEAAIENFTKAYFTSNGCPKHMVSILKISRSTVYRLCKQYGLEVKKETKQQKENKHEQSINYIYIASDSCALGVSFITLGMSTL